MPFLIPVIVGASATATGVWWWTSQKEEEPSFTGELFNLLKPIVIIIIIALMLRWLYLQGSNSKKNITQ